jgi:hypothetical protein
MRHLHAGIAALAVLGASVLATPGPAQAAPAARVLSIGTPRGLKAITPTNGPDLTGKV